jgi:hypothetical protein
LGVLIDDEHQCSGDVGTSGLQAVLCRADQYVRIFIRLSCLKPAQELALGL